MGRFRRGAVTAPLATLMLLLSVAVPLVERADFIAETVVESEHDPANCPTPHDHTVCTQVGANHAAGACHPAEAPIASVHRVPKPRVLSRGGFRDHALDAPARAPPLA